MSKNKTLSLADADRLVDTNDRYRWETYAKVLTLFTPSRTSTLYRTDGWFNREWRRGKGQWGTLKRIEISEDGKFRL